VYVEYAQHGIQRRNPYGATGGLPEIPRSHPAGRRRQQGWRSRRAGIPFAQTVAASDTSTSIVITPNGPQSQIQCGKTAIQTYSDVVYSTPRSAGKQVDLKLDVQVPKTAGRSHWSSTSRGRVRLV
jgi:hypothetical protein